MQPAGDTCLPYASMSGQVPRSGALIARRGLPRHLTLDEEHIVPGFPFFFRILQKIGRVMRRDDQEACSCMNAAPQLRKGGLRRKQRSCRGLAESAYHVGADSFELPEKKRQAGRDLIRSGRPSARGRTLDQMRIVHVGGGKAQDPGDDVCKHFPVSPAKRAALGIVGGAWRLSNEYQAGPGCAVSEHKAGSSGGKAAAAAVAELAPNVLKRLPRGGFGGAASLRKPQAGPCCAGRVRRQA